MGYIYSNAYLTIVTVAGDDADFGLLGLQGVSFARPFMTNASYQWPDRSASLQKDSPGSHHSLIQRSRWSNRKLTLSEILFSQRALFFHNDTITWECHCAIWHEKAENDYQGEQCLGRTSKAGNGFQHAPWPDLEEYIRIE